MAEITKHAMGWRPSPPDIRDMKFQMRFLADLPPSVDLRSEMPPVYDQGNLGSCTANSVSALCQHSRKKLGKSPDFNPSRLFVYYNTRFIEGTVSYDSGATIRDTICIKIWN
jgi:C1A family cysteine protease